MCPEYQKNKNKLHVSEGSKNQCYFFQKKKNNFIKIGPIIDSVSTLGQWVIGPTSESLVPMNRYILNI